MIKMAMQPLKTLTLLVTPNPHINYHVTTITCNLLSPREYKFDMIPCWVVAKKQMQRKQAMKKHILELWALRPQCWDQQTYEKNHSGSITFVTSITTSSTCQPCIYKLLWLLWQWKLCAWASWGLADAMVQGLMI